MWFLVAKWLLDFAYPSPKNQNFSKITQKIENRGIFSHHKCDEVTGFQRNLDNSNGMYAINSALRSRKSGKITYVFTETVVFTVFSESNSGKSALTE